MTYASVVKQSLTTPYFREIFLKIFLEFLFYLFCCSTLHLHSTPSTHKTPVGDWGYPPNSDFLKLLPRSCACAAAAPALFCGRLPAPAVASAASAVAPVLLLLLLLLLLFLLLLLLFLLRWLSLLLRLLCRSCVAASACFFAELLPSNTDAMPTNSHNFGLFPL